jgi:hypothetical protein
MSTAASAPRKNALAREEKRSWPAVSHICSVTGSASGEEAGGGRVLVIKSAPMVARYDVEKREEMYCKYLD